jgi:tRNA A-37 threonylcarbamoyl transferase component Bud32
VPAGRLLWGGLLSASLQDILADFGRHGQLVKHRPYRQVWRFEAGGRAYYLKFYPRGGFRDRFRRLFRGSPALREFQRLQLLQKAQVAAPRAVATLMGFAIAGRRGDAVILEGLEPAMQLDKCLNRHELEGTQVPGRRQIVQQIIAILQNLARAGLGHRDLHLGNFLLREGKVYLLDAYAVHPSGLLLDDLLLLALSAAPWATRAELQRAWNTLGPGGPLPASNRRGPSIWHSLVVRAFKKDRYFGHLDHAGPEGRWTGHVFKRAKFPHAWSEASRLELTDAQWQAAWPKLHAQLVAGDLPVLKESGSGMVCEAALELGERTLPVIIKAPRAKNVRRLFSQMLLGTRARRAWVKAWELVVRGIPTAWPLALLEQRSGLGLTSRALIIMEKVPGPTLAEASPTADPAAYQRILMACGRLLRRLEQSGLYLYDAKAQNWIIRDAATPRPVPVIIDMDSIRRLPQGGGLRRLRDSLAEIHGAAFTTEHALALARGYRPAATRAELARLAGLPGQQGQQDAGPGEG